MSDHEAMEGSVAAWVLGALDAGEAEEMRVHVEGCASCSQAAVRLRLAALAKGKVYEVWLITPGGRPEAAAVFVPDSNGAKVVLVSMPLSGFAQMAVTAEDGPDGATAPTQPPQLYGALA